MSLDARKKLADLLETTVQTKLALWTEEHANQTSDEAYREGLMDGVKLTVDILEVGNYMTQVIHIDDKGDDDLVSIIAPHDKELARLSTLLWADVNS